MTHALLFSPPPPVPKSKLRHVKCSPFLGGSIRYHYFFFNLENDFNVCQRFPLGVLL